MRNNGQEWHLGPDSSELVIRALALRKSRKIGVLWIEADCVWLSENEYDPYGSRVRISVDRLRELVEQAEAAPRKPPCVETYASKEKTIAV